MQCRRDRDVWCLLMGKVALVIKEGIAFLQERARTMRGASLVVRS